MSFAEITAAAPFRLTAAVLFLLVLAFVAWGSLAPIETPGGGRYDKVQHFLGYASLAGLGLFALPVRPRLVLGATAVLGLGIEVLQATLPLGRSGSALDLAANLAGAGCAWALLYAAGRRR